MIKAVEYSAAGTATGKQSQFSYDHTGERIKKVYQSKEASGNTTTVTTYYFGDTFEIRHVHQPWELQQDIWTSTKYVQSPGHGKIASITRGYQLPQSSIAALYGFPADSGIGNYFNLPTSLEDIGRMHSFQGSNWFTKSSSSIRLAQGLILMAIGGLIFLLFWNGHDPKQILFRSRFVPWQRLVAINVLLVFMLTGCQGDRDFGTAPSTTTPTGFEQLPPGILYNVAGTTTDGVPEGVHFYHQNHINSSSVITNLNGDVVSRYVYEAFGELIQDRSWGINTVTHKFTSQELDEETDLMYYGARYYDPSIGRFLTADTIVPDPTDAQTFNRYAYVINNPITYEDPTGHSFALGIGFGGALLFGAGEALAAAAVVATPVAIVVLGGLVIYTGYKAYQKLTDKRKDITNTDGQGRLEGAPISDPQKPDVLTTPAKPAIDNSPEGYPAEPVSIDNVESFPIETQNADDLIITSNNQSNGENSEDGLSNEDRIRQNKVDQLKKNKAKGDAFEEDTFNKNLKRRHKLVTQLTLLTESGTRTRLDMVGTDSDGNTICIECKASQDAPLTKNQKKAFPEIEKSGATVTGKGKPGFPGGTRIPPTKVNIVRPKTKQN